MFPLSGRTAVLQGHVNSTGKEGPGGALRGGCVSRAQADSAVPTDLNMLNTEKETKTQILSSFQTLDQTQMLLFGRPVIDWWGGGGLPFCI